ncbi:branched-chain amino acid ABC transporter permease [Neobacillus mesonae]|uniref:branched-chain amino acid ABC transporter permease n=1 Tax=Neobacillus mesonae TaxID=1193713 RepID=UPI00203FF5AC|nr:branched-chain amino acid ABC transporter permease [Neobacillus mesonae]MCM3568098.1 branched-chain amino acid ABC transporter permease [Neobacillus mesonae]
MKTKSNIKVLGIIAVLVVILPLVVQNSYLLQIFINIGSWTLISLGLTILLGYAGQISFAQAAFMGIGAYTAAIITVTLHWPPLLALITTAVISSIMAFLVGLPVLRFKEHYLALITIGFSVMVFVLMNQLSDITGGPGGFIGVPPFSIGSFVFKGDIANYYLIWGTVLISIFLIINLLSSRIGRALETLRSSEIAAKSMGINTFLLKMKVFIFAGVLAGIGGALYAFQLSFIAPNTFNVLESITYLTIVVVGGLRSVWGALIGAIVVTVIEKGLTHLLPLIIPDAGGELESIAYGLLLVLVLLFIPDGLGPTIAKSFKNKRNMTKSSKLKTLDQSN